MITIAKVDETQIPEVKSFLLEVYRLSYKNIFVPELIERLTTVWHDVQRLKEQMTDPHTFFATANEDDRIVGLITLRQMSDKHLFLSRLYVHPRYHKRGIGRQLLTEGIAHFPGSTRIMLEVDEQNETGKAFYAKQGFQMIGKKQIQFEKWSIPVLVLEKTVS